MGGELRQPSDFGEILSGPDYPLIVGGQAVNLWAEVYAEVCPALAEFNPFLSKDADIVGTKESAAALAQRAGWRCDFHSQRDSVVVAILTKEGAGVDPPTVEVLSEVNGLSSEDLTLNDLVETALGPRYRVPSPPVLLRAKIYNLASLVFYERPQDLRHVKMLLHIVPEYLRGLGLQLGGEHDRLAVSAAVDYCLCLANEGFAENVASAHQLDFSQLVPKELLLRLRPST